MKLHIKNILLLGMLLLITVGGTTSCKSKKKLAKQEYEAKLTQAKTDLNAIINGETQWTLEEQRARIEEIEKADFQDTEIDELIVKAKSAIDDKQAEAERIAEEERLRELESQKVIEKETSIEDYFAIIAAAPDAETANEKIAEAMQLFAAPDVPVLIIIYHLGDIVDYDAPTTAEKYLNYIKDQKSVTVRVNNIKYDDNNKITELELIKK
ncbi:MAG: hypothetical protein E7067_06765 [Lentimicrobiaceae bacterium]|nr:hypothetical protein [Lentimicrobiaceae bacterium]